jgi:hypothetical protein
MRLPRWTYLTKHGQQGTAELAPLNILQQTKLVSKPTHNIREEFDNFNAFSGMSIT